MDPVWRFILIIVLMFQAESHETGRNSIQTGFVITWHLSWRGDFKEDLHIIGKQLECSLNVLACIIDALFLAAPCADEMKLPGMGKMMNEWMAKLQDSVFPLQPDLLQNVTRRTSELSLPTLIGPGQCRSHSKHTVERVLQSDVWALSMLDSSSRLRFGPGLMDGRIQDLGNYDQCLRVREPEGQFVGQQCLVEIKGILPPQVHEFFGSFTFNRSFPGNFLMFSLCVPSSCEVGDVVVHVNRTLELAKITPATSIEVFCSSSIPSPFRTKDWFALAVFAIIPLLVLISTFYEWRASGKKSELLSSFSVISNWKELTHNQAPPDISCLDGLRIVCCMTVVYSHRFFFYIYMPYFNFQSFVEHRGSILYAILGSGSMVTESFFVINGVTRSYSFLRQRHNGKTLHHGYQSVQRYFRLTPVLAVMVLYTSTISIHMADGPLWNKCVGFDQLLCDHLWFLNLLHLSNWLVVVCRVESWFIASDFQLFLLSPLMLRPLFTRPKLGYYLLAACFSVSTLLKMVSSYVFLLYPDIVTADGRKTERNFSLSHSNTVYRLGAFVMGVTLGCLIYEIKHSRRKFTLSKRTVWFGWALTVAVFLATPALHYIYFRPDYEDNPWMSVLYVGLWERVFVGGVCWVILACTLGHGGWVNGVLSWSALRPFAKLTFAIYLSHMSIQILQTSRTRQPIDYVPIDTLYLSVADLVAATGAAVVLYLAVEMPFYRVASYFLQDKLVVSPTAAQRNIQHKEKMKMN